MNAKSRALFASAMLPDMLAALAAVSILLAGPTAAQTPAAPSQTPEAPPDCQTLPPSPAWPP